MIERYDVLYWTKVTIESDKDPSLNCVLDRCTVSLGRVANGQPDIGFVDIDGIFETRPGHVVSQLYQRGKVSKLGTTSCLIDAVACSTTWPEHGSAIHRLVPVRIKCEGPRTREV